MFEAPNLSRGIVHNGLAMASAGFRSDFLVCLPQSLFVVIISFLTLQSAFAIAFVGGSLFLSFVKNFRWSVQKLVSYCLGQVVKIPFVPKVLLLNVYLGGR